MRPQPAATFTAQCSPQFFHLLTRLSPHQGLNQTITHLNSYVIGPKLYTPCPSQHLIIARQCTAGQVAIHIIFTLHSNNQRESMGRIPLMNLKLQHPKGKAKSGSMDRKPLIELQEEHDSLRPLISHSIPPLRIKHLLLRHSNESFGSWPLQNRSCMSSARRLQRIN